MHKSAIVLSFGAIALAGCGGGGGGGGGGSAAAGSAAAAAALVAQNNSSTGGASGSGGVSSGGTALGATPQTTTFCGTQSTDVVDSALNIVAAQYTAMAAQMSKDGGVAYRYGPDAVACGTANTGIDLAQRTDTKLGSPAPALDLWWQVGQPSSTGGAFSSNQAGTVFVADDPKQRVGVADVLITAHAHNVFAQLPQLSWTRGGAAGGGIDAISVMNYRTQGIVSGDPVATGRCSGRPGFCSQGLVVFQNGVIGTVGSNTAGNLATAKLAPNKVPTGIAMTNNSEFALITVWDTEQLKGQVAVVALAGLCDYCDPYNNSNHTANGINYSAWYNNWNEWMGVYPGLPNAGDIAFMKVVGYVDLPGMAAPTEIAVTTGMDQFNTLYASGPNYAQFVGYTNSPLTNNWQKFASGGELYDRYAKGGVAVVISKSEQKVAFLDLKPLFSYFNGMYFSSNVSQTTNFGQAADQWPYTFEQATLKDSTKKPAPTVVKMVSLGARPTAVRTTISGNTPRAWVATQDGTLRIFGLDTYASGGQNVTPSPASIAEVGSVSGIGRNPTSLATSKGEPDNTSAQQVIVASRGDNKISWVRFASNGNSGSVVRTIQHKEMKDLIAVEDADNFANTNNVLSALDYAGKAVRNYRYGPAIFSDDGACPRPNGCPIDSINGAKAEYGGAMALPGKPFQMTTANVP